MTSLPKIVSASIALGVGVVEVAKEVHGTETVGILIVCYYVSGVPPSRCIYCNRKLNFYRKAFVKVGNLPPAFRFSSLCHY